jgi:peptidyl-tRNA hydrolase, PTH1 family
VLLVGLGNPGKKYEATRHNAGFLVLDAMAKSEGLDDFREKFSGLFVKGRAFGKDVVLLKPQTFMNLSGDSVQPAMVFHKVAVGDVIVVHDELDLPFGEVRVKVGGGHAGHNGIRSIIARIGSPDFVRVRVGIGRPPVGFGGDVADYVLMGFDPTERARVPALVEEAKLAVERIVKEGTVAAMGTVNAKSPPRNKPRPA